MGVVFSDASSDVEHVLYGEDERIPGLLPLSRLIY
jgi:hypothetical protein